MALFQVAVGPCSCSKHQCQSLNHHLFSGSDYLGSVESLGQCTIDSIEPSLGSKTSCNFIHHILYFHYLASHTINHCNFTIFLNLNDGLIWHVHQRALSCEHPPKLGGSTIRRTPTLSSTSSARRRAPGTETADTWLNDEQLEALGEDWAVVAGRTSRRQLLACGRGSGSSVRVPRSGTILGCGQQWCSR